MPILALSADIPRLLTITQRERNRPVTLDQALDRLSDPRAVLLINGQSGRAAVQVPAPQRHARQW